MFYFALLLTPKRELTFCRLCSLWKSRVKNHSSKACMAHLMWVRRYSYFGLFPIRQNMISLIGLGRSAGCFFRWKNKKIVKYQYVKALYPCRFLLCRLLSQRAQNAKAACTLILSAYRKIIRFNCFLYFLGILLLKPIYHNATRSLLTLPPTEFQQWH